MAKKKAPHKRAYGAGFLYLVGDVYYAGFMRDGRLIRRSTKKTIEKEALAELARLQGQAVRGELRAPGSVEDLTVETLLENHLTSMKRKVDNGSRSNGSYSTYRSQATLHLIPAFGHLKPREVSAKLIAAYRKKREQEISQQGNNRKKGKPPKKTVKDSTINREIALLRKTMRDLAKEDPEALPSLPYFKMEPESPPRTGFIKPKQFWEKLFPVLPFYLQAISVGAFFWGGRKSEWAALDCDEVDLSIDASGKPTGFIHFDRTKNKVERDVPVLPGRMYEAFVKHKAWHDLMCPEEPAFFLNHTGRQRLVDFEKAWDNACEAAGSPNLLFHDMRRSANRNMRDRGLVQGTRMQMMGQKTPSIDLRYGIIDKDNLEDARGKMSD